MYSINSLPSLIDLGNQSENDAIIIQFDVNEWLSEYPMASFGISYTRPAPKRQWVSPEIQLRYLASGVTINYETGILTWSVGGHVTEYAGKGNFVVRLTHGDPASGVKKRSSKVAFEISEGHLSSGEAPDAIIDWMDDANAVMGQIAGYAESAGTSASEASGYADQARQTLSLVDTLHDETKIFRDDAEGFARAAHGSEQMADEKAGQAESAMGAAIAAADEAGRYYASLIGTELEVDVINGTLNLYSAGDYSPIDIELNDRSLEVWGA